MTPAERELLDKLDRLVMESSGDKLKKIQEIDLLTQMDGKPFYDAYTKSSNLENQEITQKSKDPKN